MGDKDPTKILILAANPRRYEDLRLGEQVRSIKEGLKRSHYRDQFKIEARWAVRKRDFYRHILEFQPQILHFCGHGEGENGIVLEDEIGAAHLVSTSALTSFFRLFTEIGLEGVVLNAGYSAVQAEAISQVVNYVIGMNREISDEAAQEFAVAFYDGLGAGRDVKFAFDLGCVTLTDLGAAQIPILRQKKIELPPQEVDKTVTVIPPCPYQGLFPFQEKDQGFFFGREIFSQRLEEAVANQALVGVIGASGSGKSSVVFAGLVPQLRRQQGWLIVDFRPGEQPLRNLVNSLIDFLQPGISESQRFQEIENWLKILQKQEQTQALGQMVNRILEKTKRTSLLLIVDQFEELYTLCEQKTQRELFLEQLLAAINQDNCRLVFTLRADFFGYALAYRPFADALQNHHVNLAPMNEQELRSVITEPAKLLEVTLETGLTERILADVGNEPGNLPLVEFALYRLWEQQENHQLTHRGYEQIGGVKQALAHHAEKVYQELSPQEQKIAQHIFLQLVRLGEGTENTRRVILQQDLVTKNYGETEINSVLQKLVKARLIVTQVNQSEAVVDVAHEALIRHWEQLRTWLDVSRECLLFQRKIETAAREWKRQGYKPDYLWQGKRLREARKFVKEQGERFPLSEEAEIFVERSGKKQRRDRVRAIGIFLILPVIVTPWVSNQVIKRAEIQQAWQTLNGIEGKEYSPTRDQALEKLSKLGEKLGKANLRGVTFGNIDLIGANLSNANLHSSNLSNANLRGANLSDATLSKAYLISTNLSDANLNQALLVGANLSDANLSNANLNNAFLMSAILSDAFLMNTKLKFAKLNGAYLESANLEGAYLYSATLNGANLEGANLHSASLESAKLHHTDLNGATLNFANLRDAKLDDANLEGARLYTANLTRAYLMDTKNLTRQQIKSACNWKKAYYKREFDEKNNWWRVDGQANQDYIEELEEDTASNPEEQVDHCSMWE